MTESNWTHTVAPSPRTKRRAAAGGDLRTCAVIASDLQLCRSSAFGLEQGRDRGAGEGERAICVELRTSPRQPVVASRAEPVGQRRNGVAFLCRLPVAERG